MADIEFTGLPSATTPLAGDEVLAAVQSGVSSQLTADDIAQQVPAIVYVRSEADLPAPVGGIITLDAVSYYPASPTPITITNRVRFADESTEIIGLSRSTAALEFTQATGLGSIINDAGINVNIQNCILSSPTSPMFDCTGDATTIFGVEGCILTNTADLGTVDDFVRVDLNGNLFDFGLVGSLKLTGACTTISIQNCQSAADSATGVIDLTGSSLVCNALVLGQCQSSLLTGTNKFINIDPTKITSGLVFNLGTGASTSPLGAIGSDTINFNISDVQNVGDTRKLGHINLVPPTTVALTAVGVAVEVGGTWSLDTISSQFSQLGAGNGLKFDGINTDEVYQIIGKVYGTRASGGASDRYTGCIRLNGVCLPDSAATVDISDRGGCNQYLYFHRNKPKR